MKALLSRTPGGPETLHLEEVLDPHAGRGQLLIAIKACGVNFPDLLTIQDRYQVKAPRPFAPGAEIAGVVSAVGEGVAGFAAGDRVIGRCGTGGMAEMIALEADRCAKIPAAMPFTDAAAFQFTYATGYFALETRGRLRAGETVLVLGAAGGVGLAAIQIAKALGARVIAAASSEQKIAFARQHGADDGLVYPVQLDAEAEQRAFSGRLKAVLGPGGADVVVDPVGGPLTEVALRNTARGGRFLILGFTAGIASVPMNVPLLKSCDILGIDWRVFLLTHPEVNAANLDALFAMYERGEVVPIITETFPLARGAEAIARLQGRSAMGKIVVTM